MALIEMTKKYRTRDGRPVRVLCVDRKDSKHPVVAMVEHSSNQGYAYYFTPEGCCMYEDSLDLIEVTPYDGLKIDDLVMVSNSLGSPLVLRRFAGVSVKGRPLVWAWGACSATAVAAVEMTDCRLATPQEIEAARKYNMENAK